jgi:autotransporter-associated beta strand protein
VGTPNDAWDSGQHNTAIIVWAPTSDRTIITPTDLTIYLDALKFTDAGTQSYGGKKIDMTNKLTFDFGTTQGLLDLTGIPGDASININSKFAGTGGFLIKSSVQNMTGSSNLLRLISPNTITGGITIENGFVTPDAGAFGSNQITLQNNGGLAPYQAGASLTVSNDIHIGSGGGRLRTWSSPSLTLTGTITGDGKMTIGGRNGFPIIFSGTFQHAGDIEVQYEQIDFRQNVNLTLAQTITGNGGLIKSGSGTLVLTNAVSLTGTAINSGGGSNDKTPTKVNAGTLQIGNASGGVDTGSVSNDILVNASTANLVFDRNSALGFSNVIKGAGKVEKKGGGTLTLGGVNTYTGKTTVSGGVLAFSGSGSIADSTAIDVSGGTLQLSADNQVNATAAISVTAGTLSLGSGVVNFSNALDVSNSGSLLLNGQTLGVSTVVNVGSGAHVGGTGTLKGDVTIGSGGTLVVGNIGSTNNTLSLSGDVILDAGATVEVTLDTFSRATLDFGAGGNVTADDAVTLVVTNWVDGGELHIVPATGQMPAIQNWTVLGVGTGAGLTWDNGTYTITAIPEPSTYALFGGVGALALALLRRRRKA